MDTSQSSWQGSKPLTSSLPPSRGRGCPVSVHTPLQSRHGRGSHICARPPLPDPLGRCQREREWKLSTRAACDGSRRSATPCCRRQRGRFSKRNLWIEQERARRSFRPLTCHPGLVAADQHAAAWGTFRLCLNWLEILADAFVIASGIVRNYEAEGIVSIDRRRKIFFREAFLQDARPNPEVEA